MGNAGDGGDVEPLAQGHGDGDAWMAWGRPQRSLEGTKTPTDEPGEDCPQWMLMRKNVRPE